MSPFSRLLSSPLSLIKGKPYAPQNTRDMSTSIPPSQVATFASGCFWGVEHIFLKHWPVKENKGILKTSVGYTGGYPDATDPTYRQVCSGDTNHAEAVRIEFDYLQSISIELMILQPSTHKALIAAPVSSTLCHIAGVVDVCLTIQNIAPLYSSIPQSKRGLPVV